MASSDKSQLLDMGFEAARVDWALKATKNAGLQPAMDHILAHMEEPVPASDQQSSSSAAINVDDDDEEEEDREALAAHVAKIGGKPGAENDVEAKSVKCSDCGKIFKNASLVSFHAEKSGHSNFEESTEEYVPLTEEQKKQKLDELRRKLAEKRALQAKQDIEANKANEALRRKAGKDADQIKEDLKKKEALRAAEQAKKDKLEDARAKAAIKAQIEADKKARAEKAARDKAIRAGQQPVDSSASSASVEVGTGGPARVAAAAAASSSVKGKDYPETRLQVRLSKGGPPMTKAFPSDAPLSEVAEWIASEHLEYDVSTVKLSTTFPRKQYTPAEMSKSLRDNGLTPSAVLMAS